MLTRRIDRLRRQPLFLMAFLLAAFSCTSSALNLERLSRSSLTSIELLDVEYRDGVIVVPGGLGGTSVVDVGDPENPTQLSNYHDNDCLYGRLYSTGIGENIVIGAGRDCSLAILQPRGGYELDVIARHQQGDASYEDAAVVGDLVYAAAHGAGLEIISIADPESPHTVGQLDLQNSWAVRIKGSHAYVADGAGGLAVVDISNPQNPQLSSRLALAGGAKDIRVQDDFAFVAMGDAGIAMIDVADPAAPLLKAEYNTTGHAAHLGVSNDLVAVADWDDVEILRYDDAGTLELVGRKTSGGRVMGVEIVDDVVYVAEWQRLLIYRFGTVPGADLDLDIVDVNFPNLEEGARIDTTLVLRNSGMSTLTISGLETSHEDFVVDLVPPLNIAPGSEQPLVVSYIASGSDAALHDLTISSNDSDDPVIVVSLMGNGPDLDVGDPAPDFTLPVLDGTPFTLSEHRGDVVVLTFFASW